MSDMPTSAAEAAHAAEALRGDLAQTIDSLKDNLKPAALASEASRAARDQTPDWLLRYWALARSPFGLALIGVAAFGIASGAFAKRRERW